MDQSAYSLAQRFYWAKVSNIAAHPDLFPHSADPSVRRMDVDEYRKAPVDLHDRHAGGLLRAALFGELDLLVVDCVVGVQHDLTAEAVALLLLEIDEGHDERAAVFEIAVGLAAGHLPKT